MHRAASGRCKISANPNGSSIQKPFFRSLCPLHVAAQLWITAYYQCKCLWDEGAIQHPQSDRLNLDVFEDRTVIVWASHMALGLSLSSPLSVRQIFWGVTYAPFFALTDLLGYHCRWLPLWFPLKELHIHVPRPRTTMLLPASGGGGLVSETASS